MSADCEKYVTNEYKEFVAVIKADRIYSKLLT